MGRAIIARPIAPDDPDVLDARIAKIEFLGSYCLVVVHAQGLHDIALTVYLSLNFLAEQGLHEGDRLVLKMLPERMRFF